MYDSPVPSLLVSIVFAVMGFAVAAALILFLLERLEPLAERLLGGMAPTDWLAARFGGGARQLRRRIADDEDETLDQSVQSLLAILPSASLIIDAHGEVVRANPQAYRLGIVRDDSIVEDAVAHAVERTRLDGVRRRFDLETETPERYLPADGPALAPPAGVRRPNWLKVTVGRLDRRFVVVLIDDVSEAIRFSQIRDSFIVNVSEQLLGPTEALGALADELDRGGDHPDPARVRRAAGEVRTAGAHLNHMVSDLLLLIKAQEPVTPSAANRLNLMEQVEAVCASLRDLCARSGVTVRADGDRTLDVNGEAGQIRTALTKLLENAVEYSPRGGTVGVSVGAENGGREAVVRVIDQGRGIPKAEQERIFERFYRGSDQKGREGDGVGLGLSIVKHVALTHHGTVGVWSAPGQGSTFSLTLPTAG